MGVSASATTAGSSGASSLGNSTGGSSSQSTSVASSTAGAGSSSGGLVHTVLPLFPVNGAGLLDWVQGPEPLVNTDAPCDPASAGFAQCVHGGELRTLALSQTACAGLTIRDTRGLFDWTCREAGGVAHAISTGLKAGKRLSDLVDFDAAAFLPNAVEVSSGGNVLSTSPSEVFWDNPVVVTSGGTLSNPGTIAIAVTASATSWNVAAEHVSLLVKPGITATLPAQSAILGWSSTNPRNFLWVEGAFSATSSSGSQTALGVDVTGTASINFATFRGVSVTCTGFLNAFGLRQPTNVRVQGFSSTCGSLNINGGSNLASGSLFEDIQLRDSMNLLNTANVQVRRVAIVGQTQPPMSLQGTPGFYAASSTSLEVADLHVVRASINVDSLPGPFTLQRVTQFDGGEFLLTGANLTLQDALSVGSVFHGVKVAGANMRLVGITVVNSTTSGMYVNRGTVASVFRDITLVNNGTGGQGGFPRSGLFVQDASFNTFINVLSVNNSATGVDLEAAGATTTTDNTFANLVLTDNGNFGLFWTAAALRNRFTGVLRTGNNGPGACEGTALTGNNQGLAEGAGHTCLNALGSDAVITTLQPTDGMDALFVGALGTPLAYAAITDFSPAAPHQGFVPALGSSTPQSDARRSRCVSGSDCVLYDFSLKGASQAVGVNGSAIPTNPVTLNHTWNVTTSGMACSDIAGASLVGANCVTSVPVALAETLASPGNRNGICEAGETCIHTPNAGHYQGHGTLGAATDVTLQGGTAGVRAYAPNGF